MPDSEHDQDLLFGESEYEAPAEPALQTRDSDGEEEQEEDYISPTIAKLAAGVVPKTVCTSCPAAQWMLLAPTVAQQKPVGKSGARPNLECYCHRTHLRIYTTTHKTLLAECDGRLVALALLAEKKASEGE